MAKKDEKTTNPDESKVKDGVKDESIKTKDDDTKNKEGDSKKKESDVKETDDKEEKVTVTGSLSELVTGLLGKLKEKKPDEEIERKVIVHTFSDKEEPPTNQNFIKVATEADGDDAITHVVFHQQENRRRSYTESVQVYLSNRDIPYSTDEDDLKTILTNLIG